MGAARRPGACGARDTHSVLLWTPWAVYVFAVEPAETHAGRVARARAKQPAPRPTPEDLGAARAVLATAELLR